MKLYKTVQGWFHAESFFKQYIKEASEKNEGRVKYLEVGVFKGKSLLFATEYIRAIKAKGEVYGVDNCAPTHGCYLNVLANKLAKIGINDKSTPSVKLLQMESVSASEEFEDNYFDIIYIDGSHTYENVLADLRAWWPKLKPGGVLIGDDYWEPTGVWDGIARTGVKELDGKPYGVKQAVDEFLEEKGLEIINGIGVDWISYSVIKPEVSAEEPVKKTRKRKIQEEPTEDVQEQAENHQNTTTHGTDQDTSDNGN